MDVIGHPASHTSAKEAAVRIRRTVNDEIARMGAAFQAARTSRFEFLCECGDLRCNELILLTLREYGGSLPGSVIAHPLIGDTA